MAQAESSSHLHQPGYLEYTPKARRQCNFDIELPGKLLQMHESY